MGIVFENNEYALISESAFHTKLYKITGNKIISEFQEIIHPILVYVKEKFKDYLKPINIEMSKSGKIATHADLLDFIKKGMKKDTGMPSKDILRFIRFSRSIGVRS